MTTGAVQWTVRSPVSARNTESLPLPDFFVSGVIEDDLIQGKKVLRARLDE